PSEEMIQVMYDAIPYDSYDRVIAVGGGAIMDLCKLLGCKRPDTVHNLYFKRFPVVHEKDVIAIPTTCGTGSECTNISVAIVKDEKDGVLTGGETKLGLVSDDIIPNKVCLIPELLKTLPYKPFACSAIDALVHATESFLSPHRKTMTSELFSEKAMDVILKGFKLIDEKGQDARFEYMDQFVTASFYAGIAFLKAGCGPVHGMSFPLGGTYHVPHGESNYMLFGAIMDYYDEHKPDGEIMKFKELVSSILGCEVKDA
ncbi:Arylformamidase, partial [Dysosmobacter welbionis]